MTDQSENTCASCLFWENASGLFLGTCRRLPPGIFAIRNAPDDLEADTDFEAAAEGLWPMTRASDWCGEHQKRRS